MVAASFKDKSYDVDEQGFLLDFNQWDEDFAILMATKFGLSEGLSEKQWAVIRFIRDSFHQKGKCPLVYETCRANNLTWTGLRDLFPTGYLRGACLMAGITYKDHIVNYYGEPGHILPSLKGKVKPREKIYQVDIDGFLINPSEWDEEYAARKADELEIPGGLTGKHWQIIHFLRESYEKRGVVPTVFECCESNRLELDDLAELFPSGYQRGAVKISGLRVR